MNTMFSALRSASSRCGPDAGGLPLSAPAAGPAADHYAWDGAAVVELSGDVGRSGSAEVGRELRRLVDRGARVLLVDFGGVRRMDSSTLAVLLECLHRLWRRGGQIAVFGAGAEVRAWFEIFRLDGILRLSATREEALAACARPGRV
jgi:anti-anti-sigma factor